MTAGRGDETPRHPGRGGEIFDRQLRLELWMFTKRSCDAQVQKMKAHDAQGGDEDSRQSSVAARTSEHSGRDEATTRHLGRGYKTA